MGTFHTVAKEKQNGTYAANDITNQPQDLEQEEADAAKGKDAKDVKAETGGMSAGQVGIAAFKSTGRCWSLRWRSRYWYGCGSDISLRFKKLGCFKRSDKKRVRRVQKRT